MFLQIPVTIFAQDTSKCENNCDLGLNADIVSRYVWRGMELYNSPAIQPLMTFSCGGFALYSYGSLSLASADIQEAHLFATYTYKFVTLGACDYFFMDYARDTATGSIKCNNYFDYGKETQHVFGGELTLTGPEKLPLKLLTAYNFYGSDSDKSIYCELGYSGSIKNTDFDLFMGATPKAGWYGTSAGVVNIGITGYKSITINENYDILLKASFIVNPQTENTYMVFVITL